MAQSKTELFETELTDTAIFFKAMAHPARLQILQFLAKSKSCISGDISEELPLGRTTVNQHLKELKTVGLITGHTEGVKTKYCLNTKRVEMLRKSLQLFLEGIDIQNYNCE